MDSVARLPRAAGVVLALVSALLLHGVASQSVLALTLPGQMGARLTQTLRKTLATFGQYLLRVICLGGVGNRPGGARSARTLSST